jgi:peptide subunit release factor 1 (eRF1)
VTLLVGASLVEHDKVTKRYTATCPKCGWKSVKSKKDAAIHNLQIHLNYEMCRS